MNKLPLFFCVALLVACSSNTSYIVKGVLPDNTYNNKYVYMTEYGNIDFVDSTIVKNGKFKFEGIADEARLRRIEIENLYSNIILENGKIKVDLFNPNHSTGTLLNERLSEYSYGLSSFIDAAEQANVEIRLLKTRHDIDKTEKDNLLKSAQDEINSNMYKLASPAFTENKDNILGAYILWSWAEYLAPKQFDSAYYESGNAVQTFSILQMIVERNKNRERTAEGMPFVDFAIEGGYLDGTNAHFSDFVGKGKYVLVNFWTSLENSYIEDIPLVKALYDRFKGFRFEVLGIALRDYRHAAHEKVEEYGLDWPHFIDIKGVSANLYAIDDLPQIMLFAPDGTIIARNLRGDELKEKIFDIMLFLKQ